MEKEIKVTGSRRGYAHRMVWGTYGEGVTKEDIINKFANVPFGGQLLSFKDGEFLYKVYTD